MSQAGMPYTKQYNLCSVPYSLAQPLFGFNCPGFQLSIVNCSEWLRKVGCTLVHRPWPTFWLSRPVKFGRGNIIVQRLGHVDKADCLPLLASVCVSLNIACAGLSSFVLLFSKVWDRLNSQLPKEALSNRTVIGDGVLRPKTTSCRETGNSLHAITAGVAGSVH